VFWQIPNDYRVMVEVRNNGVPLLQQAPKAAITQSITQLAIAVGGKSDNEAPEATTKKSSWLNLWPARA
jgi:pilus assembly protein CpaE